MNSQNNNSHFFPEFPWSYKHGLLFSLFLLISGFIFQCFLPQRISISLHFPYNLFLLLFLLNFIYLLHNYFGNKPLIAWLASVPAAVSAISLFVFLMLLMGLIPQNNERPSYFIKILRLNHISSGIPFLITQLFFFTSLGLVILKHLKSLKGKNIWFFLNHTGLWIAMSAAMFGSGDMKRFRMDLEKGREFTNMAFDMDGKACLLPFGIKLVDFRLEEYPAKIFVANKKGKLLYKKNQNDQKLEKGSIFKAGSLTIQIVEFLPSSLLIDTSFVFSTQPGSAPAAFVNISDQKTGEKLSGWISSGSFRFSAKKIDLGNSDYLTMPSPEPEKYASLVKYTYHGKTDSALVEVNKPLKIKGWRIYQSGYDKELGKWSASSSLDIVRDPWIGLVYCGFFMVMAGSCYIFWTGRKRNAGIS